MKQPFRVLVRSDVEGIQECHLVDDRVWRTPLFREVLDNPATPELALRVPRPADEENLQTLIEPHLPEPTHGWFIATLEFDDSESLEVRDVLATLSERFRSEQKTPEPLLKRLERSLDKEIQHISDKLETTLSSDQVNSELRLGFGWSFGRWLADHYLNRFEQGEDEEETDTLEHQPPREMTLSCSPELGSAETIGERLRTLWNDKWGLWVPALDKGDQELSGRQVALTFREQLLWKGSIPEEQTPEAFLCQALRKQRWRLLSLESTQKMMERMSALSPSLGLEFERENFPLSAIRGILGVTSRGLLHPRSGLHR